MDEDTLKNARRVIKATVTRIFNFINESEEVDVEEFTIRYRKLDEVGKNMIKFRHSYK